ncbi:peptide-N(4)-(N-acetyl-beta-glucosaminyl)asparagine amidase isoform X1 [Aristolochia californica]|uniref:peptide-N(4)-(N-acetyl-beta- glucosaminyl)asparagine amidase isoform X1 n=1 Tax=Aristolochia californica TaxID=171875 RepID=UPI0035E0DFA0
MVARKFFVHHNDSEFEVDYDTEDGLEVLKFQLFSLTSILPEEQKICGAVDQLINDDSDLDRLLANSLRLLSIHDQQTESTSSAADLGKSDEELARMLQAEEEALFYQQFHAGENRMEFDLRIRPYVNQVLMYEDQIRQEAARKSVPLDELEEKALVSLAKKGEFKPSKVEEDHAFLLQLLFWFKRSFSWVNSPPCDGCGGRTSAIGMGTPLPSEIQFGASRVELYRCNTCSRLSRFPRYNDPLKLVETRKGRCGEWANCFTLYCRAFGFESRLILDFSDHVWTECFSNLLGRWIHLDPCEGIYDNPLLYEKGWKKNMSYIIAISKDGVHDVTKRYTRKWHEVLSRRILVTESTASSVLSSITKECRKSFSPEEVSMLEKHDRKEAKELEEDLHLPEDASILLPGRQSGAQEWRIARSELGSDSLSSSSCPIRICVDNHVKQIYDALSLVLSQLANSGLTKAEIIGILKMFKELILDLRSSSFRVRRTSLDTKSFGVQFPLDQSMHAMNGVLAALSLKCDRDSVERLNICLAGDPVETSLSLPVAFDVLEELIDNLNNYNDFGREPLSRPLLKFNRITSGSVLASGEELPFGIASSAFDGTRSSKWEEPNGAKGCWIIYKLLNDQVCVLEAYEFISANDAPERDPTEWILEGSEDGGHNWTLLDKQTAQLFERRFERKTYKVNVSRRSNMFRFRFLTVQDGKRNSRFQIGGIDLYGKAS